MMRTILDGLLYLVVGGAVLLLLAAVLFGLAWLISAYSAIVAWIVGVSVTVTVCLSLGRDTVRAWRSQ